MAEINKIRFEGTDYDIGGDTLPINSIVEYDGDTVPEGYEIVEDKGEVYSTEEVKIGTWIDDKPIYKKTFTSIYVSANNTDYTIDVSGLNIDNVISLSGTAKFIRNGSTQWRALPHVYDRAETTAIFIDSNLLYVRSYGFAVGQCYITLEYTKTTD